MFFDNFKKLSRWIWKGLDTWLIYSRSSRVITPSLNTLSRPFSLRVSLTNHVKSIQTQLITESGYDSYSATMASPEDVRSSLLGNARNQKQPTSAYGTTSKKTTSTLDKSIQLQDEAIDHLSRGVGNIRDIAVQIHGEVHSQNKELGGMQTSMNETGERVTGTTQRLERSGGSIYSIRNFCLLLWPLVLLIVLLLEVITHFLF